MADGERFRKHVVVGWQLRTDLSKEEKTAIEVYLMFGDPADLPFRFQRVRNALHNHPDKYKGKL